MYLLPYSHVESSYFVTFDQYDKEMIIAIQKEGEKKEDRQRWVQLLS